MKMSPQMNVVSVLAAASACVPGVLAGLASAQPCGNMHIHQGLLNLLPGGSEDVIAVQDGVWSDPATWGGNAPGIGDRVLIPSGITVVYDVYDDGDRSGPDTTRVHTIRVDGHLTWATGADTRLFVDTIFSSPDGVISVGSQDTPVDANVTADIVIIADEPMDPSFDTGLLGRGIIPHGTTQIVGADKTPFAALAGDAFAGSTALELREPPAGWRVGDTLVLGGTFFDPNGSNADNSRFHDELLTITAINGSTVTFANQAPGFTGLRWDHARPSGRFFSADDLTIYVANLSRNITFRSELDPGSPEVTGQRLVPGSIMDVRRGHLMAMHNPDQFYLNAAFLEFGRLNKEHFIDDPNTNVDGTPGGNTNTRGRYTMHLHRNLPRNNQPVDFNNCTPSVIDGCVAWGSPGWGIVHHDSYAIFQNNVTFDILGAGFVQEAGNEIGLWQNNLSIKTTGDSDPDLTVEPFGDGFTRVTNFDFGFNGEAYWIQGASQVAFVNNIAVSAAGGGVDIFSDVDANENRDAAVVPLEHLPPDRQHIVTAPSGLITVNRVPTNTFTGFEVYNSDFGLLTWNHMRNQSEWIGYTCPCDGNVHREYALIDNFKFWNIYGQGIHFQYSSQIELRNGIIASTDLATPGVDDKPDVDLGINGNGRGYGIGMNGPTKRLIVNDVIVEGWEFAVRTPLEGAINSLDLGEGTGSEGSEGLYLRRSVFRDLQMANNTHQFFRRQDGFTQTVPFPNNLIIEGGVFETDRPNQPPVADFTAETISPAGVVRLSGLAAFDADTPSDFPPYDPRTVIRNDPNDILAYAWDLDSDGTVDEHGEELFIAFPLAGSRDVTLTVHDHQGATASVTKTVAATPASAQGELIVDGSFNSNNFEGGIYALTSAGASTGWWEARGVFDAGTMRLTGQYGNSSIAQAIYSKSDRRGPQRFSFDLQISNTANENNVLDVHVFGINGEFGSEHTEAIPSQESAIPVEITPLYAEQFAGTRPCGRITREIDFGPDGFDYIYVGFAGQNVFDSNALDFIRLDNVSIVGAACSGADIASPFGAVGADDVTEFVHRVAASEPDTDFDGDSEPTFADIRAFLTIAENSDCGLEPAGQ